MESEKSKNNEIKQKFDDTTDKKIKTDEKIVSIVHPEEFPKPGSPLFSLATVAPKNKQLAFLSGQVALDPKENAVLTEDVQEQTARVMENLQAVLKQSGTSFEHVLKCTIYLSDMAFYEDMNQVYLKYLHPNHKPARTCVAVVTLPQNVKVEIDAVAVIP